MEVCDLEHFFSNEVPKDLYSMSLEKELFPANTWPYVVTIDQ